MFHYKVAGTTRSKMRKYIVDVKWDVKKEHSIYSGVYTHRLVQWISTGKIKKGEVMVWRGGLSGWQKPEVLPELTPYFREWEARQKPKKKKRVCVRRKKDIKTILVIDDEKDTCFLLKNLLGEKYKVNTVTTGREGINFVKKHKPDFVLLDLKLHDMDGLTALSRIRKTSPRTVVTMISAYGDEDIKKDARRYGAFSFLDKPLYQKKIYNVIRRTTQ